MKHGLKPQFTLDDLSSNLILAIERSKLIYGLYEKNQTLEDKTNQLSKALSEAKNVNQMQSEFASTVSHEFKTPLAIIKSSIDVLLRLDSQKLDPVILRKQLQKANKSVERLNNLIEHSLTLARYEQGKVEFSVEHFSLSDLLLEITQRFAEVNSQVKFKLDLKQASIEADKSLIDQIFTNLISNAIKYSKRYPEIIINLLRQEQFLIVSVKDNGIGIPKNELPKLFSKFYRAKNAFSTAGTGLGLYLVKRFIEMHDGQVEILSEPGKGTEIIVKLPINYLS